MKIGSFVYKGQELYGVFSNKTVTPAKASLIARHPTLRDLLHTNSLEMLKSPSNLLSPIPCTKIKFRPPIPNPNKVICVGMNYPKPYPVDGVAQPNPKNIILFGKEHEAFVGHGEALEMPYGEPANSFDYEGEIAVVIGRSARNVSVARAMEYVLGYAPFNDGSVREWQKHSIYAGKNFANSSAWGPWITTADALPDFEELLLNVVLNGKTVQSARGGEMIFSVAEQISYASSLFTLHPGDVIATVSPDGTGGSRTPKLYLKSNDILTIAIDGIGTLSNTVL